jgi:hypothetical protein
VHAAADSLAARFALTMADQGMPTSVTAVDGEIIVDERGRKFTTAARAPANNDKVRIDIEQGVVVVTPSLMRSQSAGEKADTPLAQTDITLLAAKGIGPGDCRDASPGDAFLVNPVCQLNDGAILYQRHLNATQQPEGSSRSHVKVSAQMRQSLGLPDAVIEPQTTHSRPAAMRIPTIAPQQRPGSPNRIPNTPTAAAPQLGPSSPSRTPNTPTTAGPQHRPHTPNSDANRKATIPFAPQGTPHLRSVKSRFRLLQIYSQSAMNPKSMRVSWPYQRMFIAPRCEVSGWRGREAIFRRTARWGSGIHRAY